MADIRDLFAGKASGVPAQQRQPVNLKVDINSLPDMPCIKCGQKEFINITRIKKLSRTVSPTGQEGNINVNMLKCSKCGWLFNPKEWEDHNAKMNKTVSQNEKPKVTKKQLIKEVEETKAIDDKELCRKCGVFYKVGTEHQCKE